MPEPAHNIHKDAVKAWQERDALQEKLNRWIAVEGDVVAKLDEKILRLQKANSKLRRRIKNMEP